MNLFEEQIKKRIYNDHLAAEENLQVLSYAVRGKDHVPFRDLAGSEETILQMGKIFAELKIPMPEKLPVVASISEQIDLILQPSGTMKRRVELSSDWWKMSDGPMLAQFSETGDTIALIPNRFHGYHYTDLKSGAKIRITDQNQNLFAREAFCFYKPLPNISMTGKTFVRHLLMELRKSDILILILAAVASSIIGLLIPFATGYAFSAVIPSGKHMLLISLGIFLLTTAVSGWLLNTAKHSVMNRISNRLDVFCENALYSRVIRLPASFFEEKSAGGLSSKVMALNTVPALLMELLFGTFLTLLVSLVYILQIISLAKPLAGPVLVIYLVEILFFLISVFQETRIMKSRFHAEEANSGLVFALLSGIQKIKVSGSEQRAFAKWMQTYAKKSTLAYKILFPSSMRLPIMTAIHMLGTLWIYSIAFQAEIPVSEFAAFSSAFGLAMAGIYALSGAGTSFATISSVLKLGEDVLKTVPEETDGKLNMGRLSGSIRLNHVTFRYHEDAPAVLNDISLSIEPGEYVAIVGRSGCGKSTLLKLLLGFAEPQQGMIYYDDYDLGSLDKTFLRRNIGTVLQDGKLFAGDIYSNITITAPWMSMDDAWKAAEKAGMAEAIREMPMGMHTLITEGGGGISGGQKQRLLIARAICSGPSILMLDEATSALDNITQKIVKDSLDHMNNTRIVIAHRLSTIQNCDRILVLDQGKIAEDGTFEELLAGNGIFKDLVRRQMMED